MLSFFLYSFISLRLNIRILIFNFAQLNLILKIFCSFLSSYTSYPTKGFDAVWIHINQPIYSTIIYVLKDQVSNDAYCEISNQLSITYSKKIIFWPCPKIKVGQILIITIVCVCSALSNLIVIDEKNLCDVFAKQTLTIKL